MAGSPSPALARLAALRPGAVAVPREHGALDLYDEEGRLIARMAFSGDRHGIAIDLAHLVPGLLATRCRLVILRHSHPSGNPEPSDSDIAATRAFASLLRLLGVHLHDHVIEAASGCVSFRLRGLL